MTTSLPKCNTAQAKRSLCGLVAPRSVQKSVLKAAQIELWPMATTLPARCSCR